MSWAEIISVSLSIAGAFAATVAVFYRRGEKDSSFALKRDLNDYDKSHVVDQKIDAKIANIAGKVDWLRNDVQHMDKKLDNHKQSIDDKIDTHNRELTRRLDDILEVANR